MLALALILSFVLSGTLVWIWSRIRIVNNELDIIENKCSSLRHTVHFLESVRDYKAMSPIEKFHITFNL